MAENASAASPFAGSCRKNGHRASPANATASSMPSSSLVMSNPFSSLEQPFAPERAAVPAPSVSSALDTLSNAPNSLSPHTISRRLAMETRPQRPALPHTRAA